MKFTPFLLFLLLHLTVCSQSQSRPYGFAHGYKVAARFNFTGLADPFDTNLSAGAEWILNPHWSVVADLAHIYHSRYIDRSKKMTGYLVRPAIRYYPLRDHEGYLEAVVFYKHVDYYLTDSLGRNCVNGMPMYQEYTSFVYGKRVAGMNLQAGIQENLSRSHLLRFEAYIGFGLRFRKQDVRNQPNSCYNQLLRSGFVFDLNGISGSTTTVSFPGGLRLIYCIR